MTRRALVTGGNGFVAQWAIRAMLARGWEVTAAAHGPPPPGKVLTDEQRAAVRWHLADVTRQEELRTVLAAAEPDVVLHLAAVSHVPDAMNNPAYAYEVNVVGTVRLLTEIRRQRDAGGPHPRASIARIAHWATKPLPPVTSARLVTACRDAARGPPRPSS